MMADDFYRIVEKAHRIPDKVYLVNERGEAIRDGGVDLGDFVIKLALADEMIRSHQSLETTISRILRRMIRREFPHETGS